MGNLSAEDRIAAIYSTLFELWGKQHWWPAQSRFEVIVGAYLTQNTSWLNVELAMKKLRGAEVLSVGGIRRIPLRKLQQLIRSSGYFRQKASRLKNFVRFLDTNYGGSLTRMFAQPTTELRQQLLSLNGIGPETADSILLYAGQHPIFVVDAYTRRIAARHDIAPERASYEHLRSIFEQALAELPKRQRQTAPDQRSAAELRSSASIQAGASHTPSRMSMAQRVPLAQVFNEMHGLIVGVGKTHCLKSQPKCDLCPLKHLLPKRK